MTSEDYTAAAADFPEQLRLLADRVCPEVQAQLTERGVAGDAQRVGERDRVGAAPAAAGNGKPCTAI